MTVNFISPASQCNQIVEMDPIHDYYQMKVSYFDCLAQGFQTCNIDFIMKYEIDKYLNKICLNSFNFEFGAIDASTLNNVIRLYGSWIENSFHSTFAISNPMVSV